MTCNFKVRYLYIGKQVNIIPSFPTHHPVLINPQKLPHPLHGFRLNWVCFGFHIETVLNYWCSPLINIIENLYSTTKCTHNDSTYLHLLPPCSVPTGLCHNINQSRTYLPHIIPPPNFFVLFLGLTLHLNIFHPLCQCPQHKLPSPPLLGFQWIHYVHLGESRERNES